MSSKKVIYLGILLTLLLVLALGGWLVNGAKALTGQTQRPRVRPRFA